MKLKSILLLLSICAGTLFAAEKVLELTPGKFHYYGSKANIAKVKQSVKMSGGGGANPLVINYDVANLPGYNEIRYGFSKPFNAGKDSVLEFDFEVSRPTKFMLLIIRSKNSKVAAFWFSTLCGGGWHSALIPNRRIKGKLKDFAKRCNPEEITQIAFAFLPNPKEDREKLEVDKKPLTVKIYPLRFVPVKSNTAPDLKKKQQEYNKKITSYKADLRPFAPLKQVRKGGFFLVKDGKAQAEIVLPAKSDAVMDFAAKELTLWIKNITGAELRIHRTGRVGKNHRLRPQQAQIMGDISPNAAGPQGHQPRVGIPQPERPVGAAPDIHIHPADDGDALLHMSASLLEKEGAAR